MDMTEKYKGITSLITVAFLYSFWGVLSRIIGFSLPLYYQTALRAVVAVMITIIILSLSKQWKEIPKRDYLWITFRAIFGIIAIVSYFIALNFLQIGLVYLIFFAGFTIGGYMMGKILFREKITQVRIVSLLLSLIGLYLIYSFSIGKNQIFYVLISLISGMTSAVWSTLAKKITQTISSYQLTFWDNVIGALITFIASLILSEKWIVPAVNIVWGVVLLWGFFYVITAQLIIYGFRRLDAQIGSLIMLAEVPFSILVGFMIYQEVMQKSSLIGGLLIMIAIVLPIINNKR